MRCQFVTRSRVLSCSRPLEALATMGCLSRAQCPEDVRDSQACLRAPKCVEQDLQNRGKPSVRAHARDSHIPHLCWTRTMQASFLHTFCQSCELNRSARKKIGRSIFQMTRKYMYKKLICLLLFKNNGIVCGQLFHIQS